jgi:hypothetical protein
VLESHSEFEGRVRSGINFSFDDDMADGNGHGTHVAVRPLFFFLMPTISCTTADCGNGVSHTACPDSLIFLYRQRQLERRMVLHRELALFQSVSSFLLVIAIHIPYSIFVTVPQEATFSRSSTSCISTRTHAKQRHLTIVAFLRRDPSLKHWTGSRNSIDKVVAIKSRWPT